MRESRVVVTVAAASEDGSGDGMHIDDGSRDRAGRDEAR